MAQLAEMATMVALWLTMRSLVSTSSTNDALAPVQWVQLFTPPQVPWKFTRVCIALALKKNPKNVSLPYTVEVHGSVGTYPVMLDIKWPLFEPDERLSSAGFSARVTYTPPSTDADNASEFAYQWVSIDVDSADAPLVAWDQGVFVGVQWWTCVGHNYSGVPPAWSCDLAKYNDGVCDCGCGTSDIDCSRNFDKVNGCNPGETCNHMGRCILLGWENGPCTAANYWHYDGCQCDCGERYNDSVICDCGCGTPDPDCDDWDRNTTCPGNVHCYNDASYCKTAEVCDYNGHCVATGCGNNRAEGWTTPKEECDGGEGCTKCKCDKGFYAKNPLRSGCEPHCGDNITALNEECDGGMFCRVNCTCDPGHFPYPLGQRDMFCTGCGNGKKVIIGSSVGSTAGVILVVAIICALLYARKVKYGPRKLNVPLEIGNSQPSFAPVDSIGMLSDMSDASGNIIPGSPGNAMSYIHPILLLLCAAPLGVHCQGGVNECTGPGSEAYDIDMIDDPDSKFIQWVQLFTPPRVPWRFTRVCVALALKKNPKNMSEPYTIQVHGVVSVFPVRVHIEWPELDPGERLSSVGFTTQVTYTPRPTNIQRRNTSTIDYKWVTIDVESRGVPLVAWEQGVYVGVQWWTCGVGLSLVAVQRPDRKGRLNSKNSGSWYPPDDIDAVGIRAVGRNHSGVPPVWSCNKSKYNDGVCDCGCGTGDIDCSRNFDKVIGCNPGETCDQSGRCIKLDWSKGPCTAANYWHYDGCHMFY
eukprot:m51a1_g12288 putative serine-threonine protein (752) ;mRNA; f:296526-302148